MVGPATASLTRRKGCVYDNLHLFHFLSLTRGEGEGLIRYRQHACVLVKSVSTACWLWPLETSGSRINGRTVLQGVLGNRPLISAASWFLWTSVYDLRLVMVPEAGLNDNKKTEDNKTSSWNHKKRKITFGNLKNKNLETWEGPLMTGL